MARSSTSWKKGESNPGRGKSFKTKLLDVIREESLIGAKPDIDKKEAEKLYLKHVALRAFDTADPSSGTLLRELMSKSYPTLKSTLPTVTFDFLEDTKPADQAAQVLKATADGNLSPDVAQIFISSITAMMKIEEVTEIADRLCEIEKALGLTSA